MKVNISNAKTHFSKLIQELVDEKEKVIYIYKNHKPIAQLTLIKNKDSKRVGVAKKELGKFDLSLDEFNNIPIDDFYSNWSEH